MEELCKYDEKFENEVIDRIKKYDAIDLLSKVSCSSFFLRTSIFVDEEDTVCQPWYSKSTLYLSSLFITRGMNLHGEKIKYNELKELCRDIMMLSFSKSSLNDEVEAISMSQNSKSEVLEKFKGYYISTFFYYQRNIIKEMNIEYDDFVDNIFSYLGIMFNVNKKIEGVSFEEYINDFDNYDESCFEYNGKYRDVFLKLSSKNGCHSELYVNNSLFYPFDILHCCFLNVEGKLYCFVPELITGCLPKYFSSIILDKKRIEWYDNRKNWSEESVAALFEEHFKNANIHLNNYYYPVSKKNRNENDIVVEYKGYLFIVEIKAANVNPDPVHLKEEEVIKSYSKQVDEGIEQCNLFEKYFKSNDVISIYNEDNSIKCSINQKDYIEVFKITVTFEEMGSFLPGYLIRKENINSNIVINFYDLQVVFDYLDNPALSIKYLQERKCILYKNCQVHDELTFLGIFTMANLHFSSLINQMVEEPPFTNGNSGYLVLPEAEFMPEIERYYSNINGKKPDFNINVFLKKCIDVDYRNISSLELQHIVGLLNMPLEQIEHLERRYTVPESLLVFRFCFKDSIHNYAVVIKNTKKECLTVCANYFPSHLDVDKIVAIYFENGKTKITTISKNNQEMKKYSKLVGSWNRTIKK